MRSILIILISVFISAFGIFLYHQFWTVKIGFVRSHDLIYRYQGMIEAQSAFEQFTDNLSSNTDTLQIQYEKCVQNYNLSFETMTNSERDSLIQEIEWRKNNLIKYSQIVEEKTNAEEQEMLEGVLNKVNSFVESYSKKNGYDIVFGTTTSGNLLYGEDAIDLTEIILVQLNDDYHAEN